MGKGCHPEVTNWIEIHKGMIEEPVIIPPDNEVIRIRQLDKKITVLYHNISYYLSDDSTVNIGDCEYEHIHYSIEQGIIEGELCKTDPKDENITIRGYWKITNPTT